MESFKIMEVFPSSPDIIYKAWLDSGVHAQIIKSSADIEPKIKGKFIIWDNYISGITIELIPNKKIVQTWRTTDFPVESPDSKLELIFKKTKEGTELTLIHSNIPDGQGETYKQGWMDYYFKPLQEFLA